MTDIKNKKIIYTFDSWEDYDDLMEYLEDEGVRWAQGEKPTEWKEFRGIDYNINSDAERLVIFLRNGKLSNNPIENMSFWIYRDYEAIHWKKRKKKDISLAEFLGWEEDVVYNDEPWFYTIINGELYTKFIGDNDWAEVDDYKRLKNLKKYEPKYYAKIKGWELLEKDKYYFRWNKEKGKITLGGNNESAQNKAILDHCMTKEEWNKHGINEYNAEFVEV